MPLSDMFVPTQFGRVPDQIPAPDVTKALANSGTYVLATSTAESVTIPSDATIAMLQGELGVDFWWNPTATATIPAADDTSDPSYINPVIVNVENAGSSFSLIADSDAKVSVLFF